MDDVTAVERVVTDFRFFPSECGLCAEYYDVWLRLRVCEVRSSEMDRKLLKILFCVDATSRI